MAAGDITRVKLDGSGQELLTEQQLIDALADTDPSWTGLHTFDVTAGGIRVEGNPALSENWLGLTQNFGAIVDIDAAHATKPEGSLHVNMTSAVGSGDIDAYYKTALSATMSANSGSANGWAASFVASVGAGGTKRGAICLELDLNNLWGDYTGHPASPYASNLHITGLNTGGFASAGITMEFAGNMDPMWEYGIHLGPAGYNPFNTAAICVYCDGAVGYQLAGNWTLGIDLSSGTYSSYAIYMDTRFTVDGSGNLTANNVKSGTYTPTLTNTTNIDSSAAYSCQYFRVGNVVHVSGRVDIDPTAAGSANTVLGMTLPIASNFTNANAFELAGTASANSPHQDIAILADTTNDRATFQFASQTVNNMAIWFQFSYRVV